jgi:hypothetical protein
MAASVFSGIGVRILGGVLASLLLVGCGLGVYGGYVSTLYFGGERVSAHVDSCKRTSSSRRGSSTVCRGSWKSSDGQQHSGTIEGAGDLDQGRDIQVRVVGDSAVADSPFQLWPLAGSAVCLLLAMVAGVFLLVVVRSSRRNTGPYPGTYPPQPGGYPPYRR